MDLDPKDRWPYQDIVSTYNQSLHDAVNLIGQFIPAFLDPVAYEMALLALPHLGDYQYEIMEAARVSGIPLEVVTLLNIIYEVEAGCTSIISQDLQGRIFHSRNLDFNLAPTLRELVIDVQFYKNGKILYYGTTFAGYFGILTGMKPGYFSITLNERDTGYIFENALEALLVPGTTASAFLIRTIFETETSYSTASDLLSVTSTPAPSYIILSGVHPNEGVVITRDREKAADIWPLSSTAGNWFLVQTNDDHWLPPEDDRRQIAINGMKACTQSLNATCIFHVLSTPDVLNDGTTYTTIMSAQSSYYSTTVRN
uniref:N-acylethanolamine-hydrolyzing acid amidase n=1 Tax=Arcella intermedia TaxID=1963864 RepID=A0A6B2LAN1_9EUKA